MKKLLIIQLDEAYFLFETLLMLERNHEVLKEFELTILVNPEAYNQIQDGSTPIIHGITTNLAEVLKQEFDTSANLSMADASWKVHDQINACYKIGAIETEGKLLVPDVWSTYLMTLKARAPFLTFHLQDIYKNILGIKRIHQAQKEIRKYQHVVYGMFNTDFFKGADQESLINSIVDEFPHLTIKDISEVDMVSDLSHILYVGPATLEAVKLCEDGARGIFVGSSFQGFNLLPHDEGHFFISTRNSKVHHPTLFKFISHEIHDKEMPDDFPYSVYLLDEENLFGSYMRSLNSSDENYPIYQSHVVLWNFVLNLFDINLEIIHCNEGQVQLLKSQLEVLSKLIRLYDYAMSSINTVHTQAKKIEDMDQDLIAGHLNNLREIEDITDKISQSQVFLRPFLDFYRIRRGQNAGSDLLAQAQDSFLLYSEEHQALQALQELFTVTLHKNEVSI